ncbi:MAG TPA: undecaprenyl-diphosphate phosphatase [Vicinamibacterales bacterium]|nr:undecaprenyl-diphosphate phosphatase [Vicinamibacterales bacterium]
MTDYAMAALLGIVEGLTEFLPVSSTAHLRIAEALLRLDLADPYWKMFTIVIQLGAVLCLPIYFAARLARFLASYPRGERGDRGLLTHPLALVGIAFVVTAVPAFLLTKIIGRQLERLDVMGLSLVVGGVVMWIVDARHAAAERRGRAAGSSITTWDVEDVSLGQAIWIGACQILSAVFPGTSRSMATIAAGQVAGMSRAAALEFSFLLSLPTMFVATAYDLLKSVRGAGENPIGTSAIDAHGWATLAVGFAVSFVVAYGSVAWLMAWVRRRGFVPFAVYRIAAGGAVLAFMARLAAR